jgi:hypothetical protein
MTFWFAFSMDRGLSLNFGRSPTIQDYDITASRPSLAEVQGDCDMFLYYIGVELAYIQGDIYQQLYSGSCPVRRFQFQGPACSGFGGSDDTIAAATTIGRPP